MEKQQDGEEGGAGEVEEGEGGFLISNSGWPHYSQDKIPCVFPEFSLC